MAWSDVLDSSDMAERDDNSTPATLANLWLKSKSARTAKSEPTSDRGNSGPQLGLLFSEPPLAEQQTRREPQTEASVTSASAAIPPTSAAERRIWTIRDLVMGVRRQVERNYEDIWVEGEISNCRPAASGHIYFTLKDGEVQLAVVIFRMQAQLLRFRPEDGLAVLARGRVSVYEPRGQLQLIAETLEPRGSGALQLAFEQLKARLLAEGLFDALRKRPLPAFPRCVGVITSTGGAVLHDIIKVVRRRHARLNLLVYPAVVQGPACCSSVAAGIRWFNAHPDKADLVVIARGGGSIEDLAGFNDEVLARIIAASKLPVVSAVGHETDFTIADFVADLRAPTPSAAAELITAAQHRIEERVQALDARVRRAIRYQVMHARQRFAAFSIAQNQGRLQTLIGRRGQHLDDLQRRLEASTNRRLRTRTTQLAAMTGRLERQNPAVRLGLGSRRLERAEQSLARIAASIPSARAIRLDRATARLQALSPLAVLNRGYALVYQVGGAANGTLLRDSRDVQPGATIRARLAEGALEAEVTKTSH
jgi:exodeoxyribonuclease VII large subunit